MKIRLRHFILLVLLAFVLAARLSEQIGEWYSTVLYPLTSSALSWLVSWIPFSLEELVVAAAVILLIYLIVSGSVKHEGFRIIFSAHSSCCFGYMYGSISAGAAIITAIAYIFVVT